MILKLFAFFVLDLICLAVSYWKWAVGGNVLVPVLAALWCLTAGVERWPQIALIALTVSLCLTGLAATGRAAYFAWRSRNQRFRLLGIHG